MGDINGYAWREISAAVNVCVAFIFYAFDSVGPLILTAAEERKVHFPVSKVAVGIVAI